MDYKRIVIDQPNRRVILTYQNGEYSAKELLPPRAVFGFVFLILVGLGIVAFGRP